MIPFFVRNPCSCPWPRRNVGIISRSLRPTGFQYRQPNAMLRRWRFFSICVSTCHHRSSAKSMPRAPTAPTVARVRCLFTPTDQVLETCFSGRCRRVQSAPHAARIFGNYHRRTQTLVPSSRRMLHLAGKAVCDASQHPHVISQRDMATARFLLEVGVDGFAMNKRGRSPLSMAIEVMRPDVDALTRIFSRTWTWTWTWG